MKAARVELPSGSLAPGGYNFTLCVSKGDNSACGSVVVSVVSGEAPTFVLRAEDTVVNPGEKTIVRAVVRAPAGTRVSWECVNEEDFDYFDLAKFSASGVSTTFSGGATGVRERPFHLEIPAGTMEEGAKYKFRLTASTAAQTASVSTILETMALPIVPNCSVSIRNIHHNENI